MKNGEFLRQHQISCLWKKHQKIMIAKAYRLTEREVRKVLHRKKPFFSYMFIANILDNKLEHGRCGILLSSKVSKGSVNRNFWRRRFYDTFLPTLHSCRKDIVFVPKK